MWVVRDRTLSFHRPFVLGILNVTPDSFSDGGRFFSRDAAVEQGERLLDEGADAIDVGGESTRPQGATPVDEREELERVIPVIEALRARRPEAVLSIDTVKSGVAGAALAAGAQIVNDVSGFRLDSRMPETCAAARAGVILMHSRGGVRDMATYAHASYGSDPTGDVIAELTERARAAEQAGVPRESIALDPGIGFSKRSEDSLRILREIGRFVELGYPVAVGVSRKRFIGEITGRSVASERLHGTTGANVMALAGGASIFRVHDVRAAREALDVAWAIRNREDAG